MSASSKFKPLFRVLRRLGHAALRFPVPLACAAAWTVVTIYGLANLNFENRQIWNLILGFLLLGFFLSLSIRLFAESRGWPARLWLPLSAAALGLLAAIVFLWPYPVPTPSYATRPSSFESPLFLFLGPAILLLLTTAPFLRRGVENRWIWEFNFKLWTRAILWLALILIPVIAAAFAMQHLAFQGAVHTDRIRIFGYFAITAIGVIWPWLSLASIPDGIDTTKSDYMPRIAAFAIGWLVVPAALLSLLLLVSAGIFAVAQFGLSHRTVAWSATAVALFGLLTWHAAYPLRDIGNGLVRIYFRIFHVTLILPVLLLALAVGTMVENHGVTLERYGLILLAVWLAGIAIHGMIVRRPRLNVAPVSLAVLMVLALFGPWGATAVSIRSQMAQLDELLEEAGLLKDGGIVEPAARIQPAVERRASGIVDHIVRIGGREALLDRLEGGGIEVPADAEPREIVASLGITYANERRYRSFKAEGRDLEALIASMRDRRNKTPRECPPITSSQLWFGLPSAYRSPGPIYPSQPRPVWRRAYPVSRNILPFEVEITMPLEAGAATERYVEIDGIRTRVEFRMDGKFLQISTARNGAVSIDVAQIAKKLDEFGTPGEHAANDQFMTAEGHQDRLDTRVYFTSIKARERTICKDPPWPVIDKAEFTALIGFSGVQ